ncbi:hypothetical protein KEM48_013217 [Puccinia striiformis f. sp. tritici PST-130]|nr:hypothetical protein KEM48_013217 [Puccinia striiformis f. sp. tritici PST-130]
MEGEPGSGATALYTQCTQPAAGVWRRGLDPRGPLYKASLKAKAQRFHTYRYTVLLAFEEHHHQPDQNFLQNALFRLLPCALSDLPAPHVGPAFAPQPSITYTNFLTCKQSKLPIGPPKNSCCDKAIPGVKPWTVGTRDGVTIDR